MLHESLCGNKNLKKKNDHYAACWVTLIKDDNSRFYVKSGALCYHNTEQ